MLEEFLIILRGVPWTIALTVLSLLIGLSLGLPLMLARTSRFSAVRVPAIALIALIRAIPPIVWVFIVFFGIGSGLLNMSPFFAALVGLGLIASANMAEIYRGGLISIHKGQLEASAALNFSAIDSWREVIFPQMIRVALPASASYAIGLLKDTAVASTIGVTDIAYQGARLTQETFEGLKCFGIVGILYILLSLPIAWGSRRADAYLKQKVAR